MALDKKQYDRGGVDSAEELDAYGVWVKSEPQDFTADMAESADFDAGAMPYEAGFDSGFDDLGSSDFDFGGGDEDTGTDIPGADFEDSEYNDFAEEAAAYSGQGGEEASNQLLMKIAGELSSIKTELNSLKREFAEIRAEGAPSTGSGGKRSGFFAEDDDDKIALTGDEMDHFLNSTDFSEEDGLDYDSLREKDEAALKEAAEQNEISSEEASSEEDVSEEIKIDFDNLGIDLEQDATAEPPEEFPPLDEEIALEEPALEAAEDDLSDSSFDDLSFDTGTEELVAGGEIEELAPLEDSEELMDLRLEGASPLSPAPENTDYLEEDPFALDTSDFEDTPLDENAVKDDPILGAAVTDTTIEDITVEDTPIEDTTVEDTTLSDSAFAEDMALGESLTDGDDLSFDDSSFDMGFDDDLSLDSSAESSSETTMAIEEEASTEQSVEVAVEEAAEPVLDEPVLEEPVLAEDDLSFDSASSEISGSLDDSDLSFDAGPLELSATGLDDTDFSFDDDDTLELSMDDASPELSTDDTSAELSLDEASSDDDITLDASEVKLDESALSAESPSESPSETAEQEFDADSLDLTDAVIDEPDLSAGLVEAPLEEPVLGDISFDDDISLDMDDFGTGIVEPGNALDSEGEPVGQSALAVNDDDSLAQIIPEGFEVNAEEAAVSGDDDDDELALSAGASLADASFEGGGVDIGISPGLKGELKSVLAYMDHLLESLPEEKIEEFAKSEYFDTYKKIFKELGLV